MFTELFILNFKHLSFWQTMFKKQAKPNDLSLSFSTWVGFLQSLQTVKALTKVDNFSKDAKMFFSFPKNISCGTESLCDSLPIHHYKSFCQLLLDQGHHRYIHYNSTLFDIHSRWSISLGCNTSLCSDVASFLFHLFEYDFVGLFQAFLFFHPTVKGFFYIFSFISHSK